MYKWIAAAVLFFALAVAIPVVYTTWYVQDYARHSCQALDLLTAKPAAKPQPGKPTTAEVYRFYQALVYWEHADGCK